MVHDGIKRKWNKTSSLGLRRDDRNVNFKRYKIFWINQILFKRSSLTPSNYRRNKLFEKIALKRSPTCSWVSEWVCWINGWERGKGNNKEFK